MNFAATVKFSSNKGCFVYVPEECLTNSKYEIKAFKLYYGENKEAYVSCLPTKSFDNANPCMLINAKFAEKLELKEKEKVLLQPLNSCPANVQEVTLEPLTSDDWEILELNAKIIERELMNQIRIIWKDQVFPVWVNNICIFVKIAQTNPSSQPLLLAEFTELHIVPKGRNPTEFLKSPEFEKSSRKSSPYSQFTHLRQNKYSTPKSHNYTFDRDNENSEMSPYDLETKSIAARGFSLLSSFFSSSSDGKTLRSGEGFVPLDIEGVLRVIPYTRPGANPLPIAVLATTVFICSSTYVELFGSDEEIPPCFVAILKKYPSPESRKKGISQQQKQPKDTKDGTSNDSNKSTEKKKSKSNIATEERPPPFNSVTVTVMVVKSSEEDEFNLPLSLFYSKNLIVVPKELKRCLNLEVASLVLVRGVQTRPISVNKIVMHPVSVLPSNVTDEIISANFSNWAFKTGEPDASYVISDGTLVSLRCFGTKYEFFMNLIENLDQSVNLNSSSLSTLSSTSGSSEQKPVLKYPLYGYINQSNVNKVIVVSGNQMCGSIFVDRPYLRNPECLYLDFPAPTLQSLGGVKNLVKQAFEALEFCLKLRPISYVSNHPFTFNGSILICGPKGVGKSSFANALCKKLANHHYVFVKTINCLPFKGKRIDTIAKKWDECLIEAAYCQPSIILFEDLDFIAYAPPSHEQEASVDGLYISNIVQAFIHLENKMKNFDGQLCLIATAQSTHSLHPLLMNTKGRHLFQHIIDIKPPDIEERQEILRSLVIKKDHISNYSIESVSWPKVASKTDGYVAQDLDSLVDRATHAAWVRNADSEKTQEVILNVEDFEMALEGYIPSSLQGIPLQTHDQKSWHDVGGLINVKKVVQQIIMWPIKYKQIFKNYRLKPQTNILLFGAPGTGKTLLAGVIANECGLNFISIKGPELLSKYIGASEAAIRDLFKRATAARPCILFFDEFDSIAPRRGHDSTGVTDRVVNQLLTQLDGVESLEGVHVLAATSRPELIDPALIRPGRLDKCILCPLPNEEERLDILKCLSSKLPLNDDIDFEPIVAKTEYFTGADLQALLYTAHIEALHDSQSSSTRRYSTSTKDQSYRKASDNLLFMPTIEDGLKVPTYEDGQKIIQEVAVIKENFYGFLERKNSKRRSTLCVSITQKNLLKVADEMRPSVSSQERLRYERVYRNFQNGASGEPLTDVIESMKRVTLA